MQNVQSESRDTSAMKTCRTCRLLKTIEEFSVRSDSVDGRVGACKECVRQKAAEWKRANPDRVRKNRRAYRAANREKVRAAAREYRAANSDKAREHNRKWQNSNPETRRAAHLRRKFGLSIEDYNHILEQQGGVCAICRLPSDSRLRVDHDHRTGLVRGLLCGSCNTAIGSLRDDPATISAALEYVRRDGTRNLWLTPPPLYFGNPYPLSSRRCEH